MKKKLDTKDVVMKERERGKRGSGKRTKEEVCGWEERADGGDGRRQAQAQRAGLGGLVVG